LKYDAKLVLLKAKLTLTFAVGKSSNNTNRKHCKFALQKVTYLWPKHTYDGRYSICIAFASKLQERKFNLISKIVQRINLKMNTVHKLIKYAIIISNF